jgi:hypothetical protein
LFAEEGDESDECPHKELVEKLLMVNQEEKNNTRS